MTPMMRQYHEAKRQHPDKLLFFRMGDFYEMFYDDAVLASRELEITLTSRNADKSGQPIPMCGVPHHSMEGYLGRLVKRGHKVVVCEQVEDAKLAKGLVRREVTRVVTPGTAVEEGLLESKENNFLGSLWLNGACCAAGFLDVSTGEFWVAEFEGEDRWDRLEQEMMHFRPRELLLPQEQEEDAAQGLRCESVAAAVKTPLPDWHFSFDFAQRLLLEQLGVSSLDGFGLAGKRAAVGAAGAILQYLKETRKSALGHISGLAFSESSRYLRLDESTAENLELVRGADGSKRWTLLSVVDRTKTGMGARMIRSWLLRPSLDRTEIEARLDAVEELQTRFESAAKIAAELKRMHDIERLLSRVTTETANPRDLLSLKDSLGLLPELSRHLAAMQSQLLSPFDDHLDDLRELIDGAIDEDAPASLNDGRIIRKGYDQALDELREISSSGKSFIARLEASERERTGIANLKVKYNRVFGYFIDVTKSNLAMVPEHYIRKQTLTNSERFITPELKEYEEKVLGAEERILRLEKELFVDIRRRVAEQARRIQRAARKAGVIDTLSALAQTASKQGYVRPQLDDSHGVEIRGGRHPVLELQGSEPFVPNDFVSDTDENQLLILTGPNMGGKSTYLRQNALIVILAQMGSFVPAERARIGLVDRIYTRVGASDNLARGRSTFMVEMIETANILNTATPRSLILLDEVGRGTATFDGLSIAWAVAEYLTTEPQRRARTIFATHYQEITKLENLYAGVKNCCVTVKESGGEIIFFHRVLPGVASKSYGIEVARLAGLPQKTLTRAREILSKLERKNMDLSGRKSKRDTEEVLEELQPTLF